MKSEEKELVLKWIEKFNIYQASKGDVIMGSRFIEFAEENDLLPKTGWYLFPEYEKYLSFRDFENKRMFGINTEGDWFLNNEWDTLSGNGKILATRKQVLERLSKYAIEKGYNLYCEIKSMLGSGTVKVIHEDFSLKESNTQLWRGGSCIMKDGVWAEFVEDEKEATIDEKTFLPNGNIAVKNDPNENVTFEKFGKHTYKLDWSTFDGKNVQGVRVTSVSKLQKKLDKIQKQIDKLNNDGKV